jgi:orotidine-5'-phosphate decarboxylase
MQSAPTKYQPSTMKFLDQLANITLKNKSLLCVGLDPDLEKIPAHLRSEKAPIFAFNRAIIDATHDLVCAYKVQVAFYSAFAKEQELADTIAYIHEHYPKVPVILDAKRNDISNTAALYVREAFERYKADAVTVNPFMGSDSLHPFLEQKDKGIIILCRTSNDGAKDLQDLKIVDGKPLYWHIANKAVHLWNKNGNVLLVIGATYPEELAEVRAMAGNMTFLVPGIGAQGGDVEATVRNGISSIGSGLIISSSRAIIYAGKEKDFADAARKAAEQTREQINRFRNLPIKK